jgi:hypothetical protein
MLANFVLPMSADCGLDSTCSLTDFPECASDSDAPLTPLAITGVAASATADSRARILIFGTIKPSFE